MIIGIWGSVGRKLIEWWCCRLGCIGLPGGGVRRRRLFGGGGALIYRAFGQMLIDGLDLSLSEL